MTGPTETEISRVVQAFRYWRSAAGLAVSQPGYRDAFRAECERQCGDPERAEQCARFLDAFTGQGFGDLAALADLILERMP